MKQRNGSQQACCVSRSRWRNSLGIEVTDETRPTCLDLFLHYPSSSSATFCYQYQAFCVLAITLGSCIVRILCGLLWNFRVVSLIWERWARITTDMQFYNHSFLPYTDLRFTIQTLSWLYNPYITFTHYLALYPDDDLPQTTPLLDPRLHFRTGGLPYTALYHDSRMIDRLLRMLKNQFTSCGWRRRGSSAP